MEMRYVVSVVEGEGEGKREIEIERCWSCTREGASRCDVRRTRLTVTVTTTYLESVSVIGKQIPSTRSSSCYKIATYVSIPSDSC